MKTLSLFSIPGVAGCLLFSALKAQAQFYTAPFGPGGSWNLYEVTNTTTTWKLGHQNAIAKQAGSTGVSGVAANATTGHLVAIGSWAENGLVSLMAINHTNSANVWIGLCDNDDADLGGSTWADAGTSQTSDQWYWAGTSGGTGPNGWQKLSEGGGYQAFFTGEPNNSNNEDAIEIRADGKWNDVAHNTAGTARRSVIEWEIGSLTPIAGAQVINPFFAAPFGPGGTYNLYMMVGESDTWINAHTKATSISAQGTGLPSLIGHLQTGHLLQISSRAENSFGTLMANRLLTNTYQIGANTATTNVWLGLTDSDDPGLSTTEANTDRTAGWIWAGTTGGSGPNDAQTLAQTVEAPMANGLQYWFNAATNEPNNAGGTNWPFGEDAGELRGDGHWNDLPHKIGPAGTAAVTTVRHYIIEWDLGLPVPPPEVATLPVYYTAQTGAGGTWNLYYLDYTMDTWQVFGNRYADANFNKASFTGLPSMALNNTAGHLVEIADQYEHGLVYRLANFQGIWLGLTDNEGFGGQEAGNAASNPTNQVQPFWVWSGTNPPSTATYRRWNAGEPNDSGGNEDAGEMTTTGFMNDNQINNVNGAIRRALVEWDIQSAVPIVGAVQVAPILDGSRTLTNTPAAGTWAIKQIYDPIEANLFTATKFSLDGPTNGRVFEGTAAVMNQNDTLVSPATAINYPGWGDTGLFGGDLPTVGETANTDDNQFTRYARTKVNVTEEGDYTFNIHTDDGMAFRVAGQTFISVFGLGFIDFVDKGTVFVPYGGADSNTRAVVHLAPGVYDVELLCWDATGGSSAEVSWARGVFATEESGAGQWSLVGDPASVYPTPVIPLNMTGSPAYGDGLWGLHVVRGAGTIASLTDAVNALQAVAGTHDYGTAAVINHSDPEYPGTGGIFPGELTLPGDTGAADNDFAVHGRARLAITTAGLQTICIRCSDSAALRIKGQTWQQMGPEAGLDPADSSTIFIYRNNPANNTTTGEFAARALINLPAGNHEIEFVTFDRDNSFFVEIYSRSGNQINTAEYAAGTANNGLANPSGDYRLIGYKGDGTLSSLGVLAPGWLRQGTTPSAAQPGGWPGTNIANFETWILANGVTPDSTARETVNDRDPQNPTTDLGIPNGRDIWRQTTADDNFYVEQFDATLVVPEAGTYSIGWQGDDGGYIEVRGLPAGVGFSRLESMAVATPAIVPASDGTVNGRLRLEGTGGNTRTMAKISFPDTLSYPAQFPIRSLHFEGSGGCYWEIFAGPGSGYGRMVTLLQSGSASATVADVDGLQLVGPDIEVLNVSLLPGPAFSFTFSSQQGVTYTISRTLDLVNWTNVGTIVATGPTSTYNSGVLTAADMRYLYRATK
ncbi:MAG TPA: hypothetical protein VG796_29315 [Verrucomicrobiales bacterium]|nr:hypothetical protein [Verrucomicrobiales bacterium]